MKLVVESAGEQNWLTTPSLFAPPQRRCTKRSNWFVEADYGSMLTVHRTVPNGLKRS